MSPARNSFPDLTGHLIDHRSLKLVQKIGSGAFGVVYRAIETASPEPQEYAVKVLLRADPKSQMGRLQTRELALHQIVSDHPNIVSIHRIIKETYFTYVVMDLCPSGDICRAVTTMSTFYQRDDLVKQVFTQIIDAVQFCHSNGVYHRDLKPDNILCSEDLSNIYLTDFGLATSRPVTPELRTGTPNFMSPECLRKGGKGDRVGSRHCDIWSLGIILISMLTGMLPWDTPTFDNYHFQQYLTQPDFFTSFLPISQEAIVLIRRILVYKPLDRISLAELREEVCKIDTFFLTDKEIAMAPEEARNVAKECAANQRRASSKAPLLFPMPPSLSTSSSTWSARSELPVTPETYPVRPVAELHEMSDGLDLNEPVIRIPKSPIITRNGNAQRAWY